MKVRVRRLANEISSELARGTFKVSVRIACLCGRHRPLVTERCVPFNYIGMDWEVWNYVAAAVKRPLIPPNYTCIQYTAAATCNTKASADIHVLCLAWKQETYVV